MLVKVLLLLKRQKTFRTYYIFTKSRRASPGLQNPDALHKIRTFRELADCKIRWKWGPYSFSGSCLKSRSNVKWQTLKKLRVKEAYIEAKKIIPPWYLCENGYVIHKNSVNSLMLACKITFANCHSNKCKNRNQLWNTRHSELGNLTSKNSWFAATSRLRTRMQK